MQSRDPIPDLAYADEDAPNKALWDTARERLRTQDQGTVYTYTRLQGDQIRLLLLHPESEDGPLFGELVDYSRSGTWRYTAISYTWGPPVFSHDLHMPTGVMAITESLHGALRRLRDPTRPVLVWADAVCINQKDDKEKGLQVASMAEVYQRAANVFIWLGEAGPSDGHAFWVIRRLEKAFEKERGTTAASSLATDSSLDSEMAGIVSNEHQDCPGAQAYDCVKTECNSPESLASLLRRPYFNRLWPVQELSSPLRRLTMCAGRFVAYDRQIREIFGPDGLSGDADVPREWRTPHRLQEESNLGRCDRFSDYASKQHPLFILLDASSLQASNPRD